MEAKIGHWSFLLGVALAVVFGFFKAGSYAGILTLVLVILGLVVGFLNITEKETTPFLVAAIALMTTSAAGELIHIDTLVSNFGTWLQAIVVNIAIFVTPAAIVVALKAIHSLAKD